MTAPRRPRRADLGILRALPPLLVGVLAFAAFLPSLDGQFLNWDDKANLISNTGYRGLGWTQLRWMFTSTLMGHYIPLTWLSFGVNYALGDLSPGGYHLGNLLLHALNTVLFYFIALRLLAAAQRGGSAAWPAVLAALLFGIHPLRVESVAWITERRDVLCGFFFLLSALAYLRGVQEPGPIRPGWRAVSLAAFGAALLSKAAAMPLPLALLLLDVYPLRRRGLGWRRLLAEKALYFALAGAAAGMAALALGKGVAVTGYDRYGPGARIAMVAYGLVFYPWKFLWPAELTPLYELPQRLDPGEGRFLGAMLAAATITVVLLALRRRWPAGLAAWTYSALMVLPVSGIVHSGHQLVHDRYSYLSGLGFALLWAGAFAWVLRLRVQGRVGAPTLAVVAAGAALGVLALGAGAWMQSATWRDSETLWRWALEVDPRCAVCRQNFGEAVMMDPAGGQARLGEAEGHFRQAIALRPDYPEPHYNLGTALLVEQRYEEAEASIRTYMRLAPRAAEGPERLGLLYIVQGRYAEALPLLDQARGMRRDRKGPRGLVPAPGGGAGPLQEALALLADDADTLLYVGRALVDQGKGAEAVAPLGRAAALAPSAPAARFWLTRAYLESGDRDRAREELAALRKLDPVLAERLPR